MSTDGFQLCAHLMGTTRQALAVIPDQHGVDTFLCAPCLSERIEALLTTHSPDSVSRMIAFDRCGHRYDGAFCETCYIGVSGCLSLIWSHLKLTGENRVANRLLRLLREWAREYGPTNYMSRARYRSSQQQQETPSDTTTHTPKGELID